MAPPSLECRSFWRAGSYDVSSSVSSTTFLAPLESSDFDRARVHPKFLHSNATSHKWAFGAIAELIDNAVDEIHNGASFILVDTINNPRDNSPMLLFQDDGGGMDPEGIRRCMSLGFSNKRSKSTIGQYGNGFKTSTMRLGADAIVFSSATRGSRVTYCIGLLSYTYLRREMKDDIIVPMVDFEILDGQVTPLTYNSQDDWDESMNIILEWSPFSSSEELMKQFEDLGSHGTKVLIYNLWMNDDGLLELDFDDNDEDILLRDQASSIMTISKAHKEIIQSHISNTLRFSLRAYGSVLYLRKFTNFQIILRGKPIQQVKIADELKFSKNVSYKPQMGAGMEDVSVRTTIGFAKEAPMLGIFGINVYHKNRLILPFWKVFQEGSSRGRCVVGVVEANFIEPAHDKQDFERTPLFIRLETKLRQIIVDYWKTHCHLIGYQSTNPEIRNKQKLDKQVINAGQRVKHVTAVVPQARPSVLQAENDSDDDISELLSSQTHVQRYVMEPSKTTNGVDSIDVLDSTSIEKLSEENIQLFARREELKQRELQLKQTIEELEHQIVQAKRKCNRLSGQIEFRQNVITHLD